MGRKCYVPDCLSEEGRYEDRGVTFHKIPLHSDIRPKWLTLCHIPEDKMNYKVIHVCSRHFLKVDFCRFKGKRYMLRQGVLPSVFPWSKLKKEANAHIKKETDTLMQPVKTDLEDFDNMPESKLQIKEEPCDDIGEKQEINVNSDDTNSGLQFELKVEPVSLKTKSSTTIEQKGKAIQTPLGLLNFAVNTQLEALDFNQMWFPAHIVEIDYEENEVLIHFEKYSSKYDEWISMNSSRLRPLQPIPNKILNSELFREGEKVMASWNDSRKFPATVTKIIDNDTYEVVFNDGFVKILKSHRMAKSHGKVGSAPLFDPVTGSKQDRREKKRKLNVAQLFRKRMRMENVDDANLSEFNSSGAEDGEGWVPKWENGKPLGVESVIETLDGIKKSVIVPDPRLPSNWAKHLTRRSSGASAGKWDTIIVSPEGRRFRTRSEIKTYVEENPQFNLCESMFDFSLYKRFKSRRVVQQSEPTVQHVQQIIHEEQNQLENANNLKILLVDDAYKCPIEGCEKSFRRENLAQMHVKHYHPKYTKYLESTPNVADLAYARTVGESLDKSPDRGAKSVPPPRVPTKAVTPKASTPKPLSPTPIQTEEKIPQSDLYCTTLQKSKDSEILKLLNNKSEDEASKYPSGLPPSVYPVIKLKDLLSKSEGIPKRDISNFKNASSNPRQAGIRTLLPVVRPTDIKKEKCDDVNITQDSLPKNSSLLKSFKRKRFVSDNSETLKSRDKFESENVVPSVSESPVRLENNSNYIVEGGEVIKIVRMKREEIINCTCGITEEDGLMIQCELCLCWQHAYCNNIERENQVPEKYICYICQNPMRQRSSRKYYHDQDWLKNGALPVGNYHCKDTEGVKKRFDLLKKSFDLSGLLVELSDYMHSLKVKLKIAETKNHQKLYLWSKPWDKLCLPENSEIKEEDKPKLDAEFDSQNDSSMYSILKTEKSDQNLSKLYFNPLMDNGVDLSSQTPIVPQPEEAINSTDCKINLLEHISHSHNLIEERLNNVEAQVDALLTEGNVIDDDFNRTCQTVQMLLRDLGTLQELSRSNNL